jgi:hypothetical protein
MVELCSTKSYDSMKSKTSDSFASQVFAECAVVADA